MKGMDISCVTDKRIASIQTKINRIPREKIFLHQKKSSSEFILNFAHAG